MIDIFKFFGIGLIFVAALSFSTEYGKRIKEKNEMSEAFLSLIEHLRRKIDCYLTPASALADGFESDALSGCGFLDTAKRDGVAAAYLSLKDSLPLYESVKGELTALFSGFGKEYKEGTLKRLDAAISSLKEKIKREAEESGKDVKVVRTLAVSAALGAAILII